ncbi:MobC family plasmid mobilization relaxosome protein [Phenylobacterium sp.]|uniref:MobC family plasmid mobilization relaxosome protein n=1 Tax=Phenylobacterium sp. TaxID=1871053 RepID=UPI003BA9F29D
MANFNVRVPDAMAARFDAWAGPRGGRSPALRHLIDRASADTARGVGGDRLGGRPLKLTVRLTAGDGDLLAAAASDLGLTPNAWLAALARARLQARPTFSRSGELALIAIQGELRRIGVNVNQIARALNTAVLEGRVLDTELTAVADLRRELRGHILALREGFEGNLAYWDIAP